VAFQRIGVGASSIIFGGNATTYIRTQQSQTTHSKPSDTGRTKRCRRSGERYSSGEAVKEK